LGKVGLLAIVMIVTFVGTLVASENYAFAGTTQWKSDIMIGIMEPEYSESNLELQITTYSNDGLKIEWNTPYMPRNEILVGYEILRKTLDTDYIMIVPNTNSLETTFVDEQLQSGYYSYKVSPITKPYDKIPINGLDRLHPLFPDYLKYQELIAVGIMMQLYPNYFATPFQEINNIFKYNFPDR